MGLLNKLFGRKKVKEEPVVEPVKEEPVVQAEPVMDEQTRKELENISLSDLTDNFRIESQEDIEKLKEKVGDRVNALYEIIETKYKKDILDITEAYNNIAHMSSADKYAAKMSDEIKDFIKDWFDNLTVDGVYYLKPSDEKFKNYSLDKIIILPEITYNYYDFHINVVDRVKLLVYPYGYLEFREDSKKEEYTLYDVASLRLLRSGHYYYEKVFNVSFNGYYKNGVHHYSYWDIPAKDVAGLETVVDHLDEIILRTKYEINKFLNKIKEKQEINKAELNNALSKKNKEAKANA